MRMIFVFIDGWGIGVDEPSVNPMKMANIPAFTKLFQVATVFSTDVTMGVSGLPQSATGQTALFTGSNAASMLGQHLHGRPNAALQSLIKNKNIFLELQRLGFRVTNANVFRDEYFQTGEDGKQGVPHPSVTTVMSLSAGLSLRTVHHFKNGWGVYHDITGHTLIESGYDVSLISPKEAATRLYAISQDSDFTLFEHFMTDVIGHTLDMKRAVTHLEMLDTFIGTLMEQMDFSKDILMISSDHGNIEDMSIPTHTYNKVSTIVLGPNDKVQKIQISSITDVMPAVLQLMQ